MKKIKEQKGITLIALVVTIIVLLILAGVSISMLTGENGILKRAQEAKEKTEEAARKERADLDKIDELIGEATNIRETIEQVTDKKPGELESEGGVQVINSIEDLVVFSSNVRNGNNYNGQTIKLGLSLDFNSSKSYVEPYRTDYGKYGYDGELKTLLTSGKGFLSIGERDKGFYGNFDGNGFELNNLKMDESITEQNGEFGFFAENFGKIENLGLNNIDCNSKQNNEGWANFGCLCAANLGTIESCYVKGISNYEINNNANVSSLVGINRGSIIQSYVDVDMKLNVARLNTNKIALRIGGVAGINEINEINEDVKIKNVYNIGSITISNTTNVSSTVGFYLGGVCGYNLNTISSSYSIANLEITDVGSIQLWMHGVIGREQQANKVSNTFYLKNILKGTSTNIMSDKYVDISLEKSSEEMKKASFVEVLNSNEVENVWEQDTENMNDGYPILSWQVKNKIR